VLDFGLAKSLEADPVSGCDPSLSPTMTTAGTAAGMILATAALHEPRAGWRPRGRPACYRVPADGGAEERLLDMPTACRVFLPAPDGRSVTCEYDESQLDFRVIDGFDPAE
jgi:hypothetical protein